MTSCSIFTRVPSAGSPDGHPYPRVYLQVWPASFRCSICISFFLSLLLLLIGPVSGFPASSYTAAVEDSLYNAHHPRILFTPEELPALRARALGTGNAAAAYNFIKLYTDYIYPSNTFPELLGDNFAFNTIPNLGFVTYIEVPMHTVARDLGKDLTVYIADQYDVDNDVFYSSLRLRALALGYDMFFHDSTPAEREYIKDEINVYMLKLMNSDAYQVFQKRPYLSNKTAMIASALGIAAICLDEEIDPAVTETAFTEAELYFNSWWNYQLDSEGAYKEGVLYGSWSMKHLIYYFHARKRYDGITYSTIQRIRNMESWFVYELLPEGEARTNNLNDCSYIARSLPENNTYFDWAQSEWGSHLAAWLWDHVAGPYGYDFAINADKVAIILWNQDLAPVQPDSILPLSKIWSERGLFYYRTGWQSGASSDDVLFSFYSGKFYGGHAQEDQNQFTLNAYGGKFVIDHGISTVAKQTEAHNLILIDDKGQHNAGSSIGTDGRMDQYLINNFADYLKGDATAAYTTYSPYNNYNFPFPGTDWSWGYDGGNPVNYAYRSILAVHEDGAIPPYFLIRDEIEKDGLPHMYEWRLHTYYTYPIDTTSNPIRVTYGSSYLDIHVLDPPIETLAKNIEYFNNINADPNSNVISLARTDISPVFNILLAPGDGVVAQPAVSKANHSWGTACRLDWAGGISDVLLLNNSQGLIVYSLLAPGPTEAQRGMDGFRDHAGFTLDDTVRTDATIALLRFDNGDLIKYTLTNAQFCDYNGTVFVTVTDGPACVALSGNAINIDRYDAQFHLYAPGIDEVYYRNQRIFVINNGGYLSPDPVTAVTDPPYPAPSFTAAAYPNPFNPTITIEVDHHAAVYFHAAIYDPLGRRVRTLFEGWRTVGRQVLSWDGTNNQGRPVSSGMYFLKLSDGRKSKTIKLSLIK